jgi:hypothetical protein
MKTKLTKIERDFLDTAIKLYQEEVDNNRPPNLWTRFGSETIDPSEAVEKLTHLKTDLSNLPSNALDNYQVDEDVRRLILPF